MNYYQSDHHHHLEMGGGSKHYHHHHHLLNFHYHHQQEKMICRDVPKGCLAIKVGIKEEEQQRFVVPVVYFNHPLFMQLLKEAENEYGFRQKGTITIPCRVEEFRHVQDMIEREQTLHHNHHHHGHHNHHHVPCFGG